MNDVLSSARSRHRLVGGRHLGLPESQWGLPEPKNSRNQKGAWQYANALLEPEGQLHFARAMGYAPTVRNAPLPPDLQARVGFTDEELKRIHKYDLKVLYETKNACLDFWNKSFKTGL
jgi:putative spermidine/putrescine transport system substrate-binding protein